MINNVSVCLYRKNKERKDSIFKLVAKIENLFLIQNAQLEFYTERNIQWILIEITEHIWNFMSLMIQKER